MPFGGFGCRRTWERSSNRIFSILRRAYWEVNDSIFSLEATGTKRQLYYVEPSQDMLARGVLPGALLFEGVIQQNGDTSDGKTGQTYVGTIFAYFGKCAPRRYEAEGPVLPGARIQVGMAARRHHHL